jgi:carbamoyl-phosphate synthase large subunit
MYNILVTGVGSIIGYGVIDGLKKSIIKTNIIGTDIYENAYGGFLCDHFIQGVRADSGEFIDFINDVVDKYKIDLIIPGIEQDLYKLWNNKDSINTRIVFNNDLCLNLAKNKYDTYKYFSGHDIDLIPTLKDCSFAECKSSLGLPFLIKPLSSYASKGIEVINNEREFEFYTQKNTGKCIYQRIVGDVESEFTIAVFGDGDGDFIDYIILRRKLSGEGATNKAVMAEDNDIKNYIKKICQILKPVGPLNIQVRKEKNKVYLLEINPRFSSSCSIRTMLGYNEPEMCLKYFLTKEIIKPTQKIHGSVVRYISDYFYQ